MEFRFRPDEDKPPAAQTYFTPSSSTTDTYFIEQALRAGYFNNDVRRVDFMRNTDPVREAHDLFNMMLYLQHPGHYRSRSWRQRLMIWGKWMLFFILILCALIFTRIGTGF